MTDKQIIIDGVDVSGCRYLFDDTSYKRSKTSCSITLKDCKYLGNNCYYKQLKCKEQECEELKKIIDEAKNSKLDLKSFLVGEAVQNEYEQQLDQLKAENEILKEKLVISSNSDKKTLKIIQTLTDIKEMLKEICMEECSFDWNKTSKKHCGDYDCRYGQIIQKISEVEE